ncbi:MAG: hypothetical protein J5494_00680, partial [Candidatus Methanomethylophilaceae archaeon]|nr:hypothetical protein [Candidatus Methanomethylophilaceae archaeon]
PPGNVPPAAAVKDRSLIINCSGCRFLPDPCTAECIRCMVSSMCRAGSADKVVLRTGRDTEISGYSGKTIKDAASVMRWSVSQEDLRGKCKTCDFSRRRIMDIVWNSFPADTVSEARTRLSGKTPQGKECEICVLRTRRALEQIESGLEAIIDSMAEKAGRTHR